MNPKKKRAFWPYIITVIAVIVVVALLAVFVFPALMGRTNRSLNNSLSEYQDSEHALKSPASYEELFDTIKEHQPKKQDHSYDFSITSGLGGYVEEAVAEEAGADSAPKETMVAAAADAPSPSGSDYSDTNVRTEGIYEGDIVKTDGRYIYSIYPNSGEFTIVDTDKEMKLVYSGYILEDNYYNCREFFVVGDRLYFTGAHDVYNYDEDMQFGNWSGFTFLKTFDISDRSNPQLLDTYEQSGSYQSSRMTGNNFYLFSYYYDYELKDTNYVPLFGSEKIACEDIYYGHYFSNPSYFCIGTVDLSDPGACRSAKAVLTDNGDFYVSDDTIFIYSSNWVSKGNSSYSETGLVSIGYDGTDLFGNGIGTVPGYVNDSFSIDEYNGYLRILTTINSYTYHDGSFFEKWLNQNYNDYSTTTENNNSLWILDKSLNLISSIKNIQENELVQSARFLGDVVYFVTFRNTDPLFAADLSDPVNPKMLAGIELTGFSNYLHFWDDGLLLGIGYEADIYGSLRGAKLSMFDISDPLKVREIDRYVIDENTSIISTDYSYKSVMVEPGKNLIGFATEQYKYAPDEAFDGSIGTYYVFSYDKNNGFRQELSYELYADNYYANNIYYPEEEWMIPDEEPIAFQEDLSQPDSETETASENATASIFNSQADDADEITVSDIFAGTINGMADDTGEETQTDIFTDTEEEDLFTEPTYEDLYRYYSIQYVRGLYIGDQFYIVNPGYKIYRFDLSDMSLTDTVRLFHPDIPVG